MLLRPRSILLFCMGLPAFAGSSVPGIHNFHQVNAHVYRGAQPDEQGFQYLAKIGVKVVVDLREADVRSQVEQRLVTASGMQYVNVPMTGLNPPTQAEIAQVLRILEDETGGPVFVHCKRGADRTGTVIAAYRIDHDGQRQGAAGGYVVSDEFAPASPSELHPHLPTAHCRCQSWFGILRLDARCVLGGSSARAVS